MSTNAQVALTLAMGFVDQPSNREWEKVKANARIFKDWLDERDQEDREAKAREDGNLL